MSFIKKHKVIFIILLFLILMGLALFLSIKIFLPIIQHITNLMTGSLSAIPSKILRQNMDPWNLKDIH